MFAGASGERAIELLARAAERDGAMLERAGSLAIMGAAGATHDRWRCWVWGRLTNTDALCERLGATVDLEPAALVARAHAQLGLAAYELLRGAFLVVARECASELTLAFRDQLGGRPLVYARACGGVLFAEHERDLLELLPSTPAPDRLALAQWAAKGTLLAGRTLYEGVHRLAPAHRLILAANAVNDERYWLPRYEGSADGGRETIIERLRSRAFAAVDRAASKAKRPAVSLSGGLDSACVAAGLAARGGPPGGALALAKVFPGHPELDESELIGATARHTGLALKQFPFDERSSILAPALTHIAHWRLPPASPNLFIWEPMMNSAKELGVDVSLDGEGGDELFGLAPYLIADMLKAGRVAAAWSLTSRIGLSSHPDRRIRLQALRVFGLQRLTPLGLHRRRARQRIMRYGSTLLEQADALALLECNARPGWRELEGPVWWRSLADELINGRERLDASAHLRRTSISAGVDQRHPFLHDLDLVRTVLANAPELQFDPLRDRPLLRSALRGYIPEEVRTRQTKSYFTPILLEALAGSDGRLLAGALARPDAPIRAYVRSERLEQLLEGRAAVSPTIRAQRLWQLGLANTWLRAAEQPAYLQKLHEATTRLSQD